MEKQPASTQPDPVPLEVIGHGKGDLRNQTSRIIHLREPTRKIIMILMWPSHHPGPRLLAHLTEEATQKLE